MAGAMLEFFGPASPQNSELNSGSGENNSDSDDCSVNTTQIQICQSFPRQPVLEHLIDSIEYR